nr:DNA-directed RNA polymerase subunit beta [Ipomoea batatas]GMD25899.1 DNA-directed RNA polymerase subunit beta [Ipomoea batatas]GMD28812.1 DNA-directed RNA polymerase subunit beta [Ipomoea batatas]
MVITNNIVSCRSTAFSYLFPHRRKYAAAAIALAEKRDLANNNSSPTQQKPIFPLKLSKTLLAQSALGIFALGFIDAGYSGDWSRIGVISKESEHLLKISAFFVVPLCLFLIFYSSKKIKD